MLQTTHLQQTDLWEAWIEFDPAHPQYFGVLYVAGEIETKRKFRNTFQIKKDENPALANTLVLQLNQSCCEGGNYLEEIIYSEPLRNISQYNSVVIYAHNRIVAVIKEIEVLV